MKRIINAVRNCLAKIVITGGLGIVSVLGFGGCESMTEADYAAIALKGYGARKGATYEGSASADILAGFLSESGRRDYGITQERAGRSVIMINGGDPRYKNPAYDDPLINSPERVAERKELMKKWIKGNPAYDDPEINSPERVAERVELMKQWKINDRLREQWKREEEERNKNNPVIKEKEQ